MLCGGARWVGVSRRPCVRVLLPRLSAGVLPGARASSAGLWVSRLLHPAIRPVGAKGNTGP
eukprot:15381959-Alexandrium_andersonii.AAC.1